MVRFVRLNRIQLLEGSFDLASLRGPSACYLTKDNTAFQELLAEQGIVVKVAPEEGVPDGSVVICAHEPLYELEYIARRLLGPGGCPWDIAQTHETLKRYLLEEAYELLDAIDSGDDDKMKEELGDVLLQPFMHAEMKRLKGGFSIDQVAGGITEKLYRRHPHVFGTVKVADADDVLRNWDAIKKAEKADEEQSVLRGVPKGMASLLRAYEVGKRVQRVGFEWPDAEAVFDKLHEEEAELRKALDSCDGEAIEAELGDLLFTCVNLARWAKVEPEEALRKMLNRFTARFQEMERSAAKPLLELTPKEWDELWVAAKAKLAGHDPRSPAVYNSDEAWSQTDLE
jgi:tetrapyrrole methylase family protein/MazG family protein